MARCRGVSGASLGGVGGFVSDGQLGIGLVGRRRSPNSVIVPRVVCDWGKKVVWASAIWHTSRMAGIKDVVHSSHVNELCSPLRVGNEDEFHRPFGGCEVVGFLF